MMTGLEQKHKRNHWPALRLAAFVLLAIASIYAAARTFELADENRKAVARIEVQRIDSRNQICLSDEREHKDKVNQLVRTYDYIAKLKPSDYDQTINVAVILQLPQTEKAGQTDTAPDFCDITRHVRGKDGKLHDVAVGLPEPDPVVPKRPAQVTKAYKAVVAAQGKN